MSMMFILCDFAASLTGNVYLWGNLIRLPSLLIFEFHTILLLIDSSQRMLKDFHQYVGFADRFVLRELCMSA